MRLRLTLFWYKPPSFSYENMLKNTWRRKGCIKTRWTPASFPPATVKWTIVGRISAAVFFSFQKWQISLRGRCTPILNNPNEKKKIAVIHLFFFNIVQITYLNSNLWCTYFVGCFQWIILKSLSQMECVLYCLLDIVSGIEPSYAGHI